MENIKLVLRYDGTRYHGWQRQQNAVTVQQVVEQALERVVKAPVTLTGCSRTDAGVHAREYVCNARMSTSIPDDKMPYALNSILPDDIGVMSCQRVEDGFHARFHAKAKEYCYLVHNARHKDPFLRNYAWHFPYPVQFDLMKRAAERLAGTYDCSVFEASGSDTKGLRVRTVYSCELIKTGEQIQLKICANGYLYHMVRIIMGTLLSIGTGKLAPDCIPSLIESRDRRQAGPTAPPQGLCLSRIWYQ